MVKLGWVLKSPPARSCIHYSYKAAGASPPNHTMDETLRTITPHVQAIRSTAIPATAVRTLSHSSHPVFCLQDLNVSVQGLVDFKSNASLESRANCA